MGIPVSQRQGQNGGKKGSLLVNEMSTQQKERGLKSKNAQETKEHKAK
jgi:hypothetical protein